MWCGAVRCDWVRFGFVSGSVRADSGQIGSVRFDSIRVASDRFGWVRFGSGPVGFGSDRFGSGSVWPLLLKDLPQKRAHLAWPVSTVFGVPFSRSCCVQFLHHMVGCRSTSQTKISPDAEERKIMILLVLAYLFYPNTS